MSSLEVLTVAVIIKSNLSPQFFNLDLGYADSLYVYYLKLELYFVDESEIKQNIHAWLSEWLLIYKFYRE